MLCFLGIVHKVAYTIYRFVQTSEEKFGGLRVQGSPGRYKILLVLSGRKPWVPAEVGLGALLCSKRGVGEKSYLCWSYEILKIIIIK